MERFVEFVLTEIWKQDLIYIFKNWRLQTYVSLNAERYTHKTLIEIHTDSTTM